MELTSHGQTRTSDAAGVRSQFSSLTDQVTNRPLAPSNTHLADGVSSESPDHRPRGHGAASVHRT